MTHEGLEANKIYKVHEAPPWGHSSSLQLLREETFLWSHLWIAGNPSPTASMRHHLVRGVQWYISYPWTVNKYHQLMGWPSQYGCNCFFGQPFIWTSVHIFPRKHHSAYWWNRMRGRCKCVSSFFPDVPLHPRGIKTHRGSLGFSKSNV